MSDQSLLDENVSYDRRETLLSMPEYRVFHHLSKVLVGRAHICPKVRISDLIKVSAPGNYRAYSKAFGSISQKHVDFAIMRPDAEIAFAVEVDDASHRAPKQINRDLLVNAVFEKAGVPLIRGTPQELIESQRLLNYVIDGVHGRQVASAS